LVDIHSTYRRHDCDNVGRVRVHNAENEWAGFRVGYKRRAAPHFCDNPIVDSASALRSRDTAKRRRVVVAAESR
jgi:hypothetical protein